MDMEFHYSENELKIINHFGLSDVANRLAPNVLFGIMAKQAFVTEDKSAESRALRVMIQAFDSGKLDRHSPEWEALIEKEISTPF